MVVFEQRPDGTFVLKHDKQPKVVEVSASQLERWAMRRLRDGAFV